MKIHAIAQKDAGLFVGYAPGFAGIHSQGETIDELKSNLRECAELVLDRNDIEIELEEVKK